jgi:glycerol-3-phosphate dehydrogenase
MGMLIPKTKDGRLLFCLPWEGGVVAGTTDAAAELEDDPKASDADVDFILGALNDVLDTPLTRNDVLSVWAGLRPLVRDPKATSTSKLSRQHVILASESKLVSVMGGKFTTYRHMGEEAIEMLRNVSPRISTVCKPESVTHEMLLQGAFQERRKYDRMRTVLLSGFGMSDESASYLIQNYGARARVIAAMAARQAQEEHAAATAPSVSYTLARSLGRIFTYGTVKAAMPYLNPLAWATWAWEFTRGREKWELKRDAKRAARDEQRRDKLTYEDRTRIREEKMEDRRAGIYTIQPIQHDKPAPRGSRVFEGKAEVGRDALQWRHRVRRLSSDHPALEAEVVYAVKYEMAQTVTDVLARRIRMGFTNAGAAGDAIERTAELMGPRLGWSDARTKKEVDSARAYFGAMDYRKVAPPVTD